MPMETSTQFLTLVGDESPWKWDLSHIQNSPAEYDDDCYDSVVHEPQVKSSFESLLNAARCAARLMSQRAERETEIV